MFTKRIGPAEGGHSHEGCCGQQQPRARARRLSHHHRHCARPSSTPEATLALMSYARHRPPQPRRGLHGVAPLERQGKQRQRSSVAEAVPTSDHCNDRLEEALPARKGE